MRFCFINHPSPPLSNPIHLQLASGGDDRANGKVLEYLHEVQEDGVSFRVNISLRAISALPRFSVVSILLFGDIYSLGFQQFGIVFFQC